MQTFVQLSVGVAFRITETWHRDDVDKDTVYVKIDDLQARPAGMRQQGRYVAGTMPRVQFAHEHPVVITT